LMDAFGLMLPLSIVFGFIRFSFFDWYSRFDDCLCQSFLVSSFFDWKCHCDAYLCQPFLASFIFLCLMDVLVLMLLLSSIFNFVRFYLSMNVVFSYMFLSTIIGFVLFIFWLM
jgi:hypothetical protein